MRRLAAFLFRDRALKAGALALATVLYGGVVLSESTRTWPGQVPIEILGPPPDAALLNALEPVNDLEYRAPLEVASRLTDGSFRASVDLSGIEVPPGGSTFTLPVRLVAVDSDVEVVRYAPQSVIVEMDPITSREIPVTVDDGVIPEGIRAGPAVVEPRTVTLRGAASRVMNVRTATGRVAVDASAINVDQEVEVVPLDDAGVQVPGVVVVPARVRVRIEVARQLAFATLPVWPRLIGELAPGHVLRSVTADPLSVTVSGEEPQVTALAGVETQPIDITDLTGQIELQTGLALADELTVTTTETVTVRLDIVPADGTRSYEAGIVLAGARSDRVYALSVPSVTVTLAGSVPVLGAVSPSELLASVDVTDLAEGSNEVTVDIVPPDGTELVAISPAAIEIGVTVTPMEVSPIPTGSPSGPGSPGPSGSPGLSPASP
ncbi:MAG: hypothetical protein H0V36_05155 [Chloroflexi bacterium]|nr:hypothetical protein [Chloroflexota bacterium]